VLFFGLPPEAELALPVVPQALLLGMSAVLAVIALLVLLVTLWVAVLSVSFLEYFGMQWRSAL